jgi:hypothetical protein
VSTEPKTGRTGRPLCPVTGLEVYEPWAGYVPEDGIKPGEQRPADVPDWANYWEDPGALAADGTPAAPRECVCGKTFEGSTDEVEKKLRGHRMTCSKHKAEK